jgi:hypothetical protein
MKNIDVTCYLDPKRMDPNAPDSPQVDDAGQPMRDPTYSAVFGFGFRKPPKPRAKEPSDRKKAD